MILIHKECVFSCFFRKIEDKKKKQSEIVYVSLSVDGVFWDNKRHCNNNIPSDHILRFYCRLNCFYLDPWSTGFDLVKRKKAFVVVFTLLNCTLSVS